MAPKRRSWFGSPRRLLAVIVPAVVLSVLLGLGVERIAWRLAGGPPTDSRSEDLIAHPPGFWHPDRRSVARSPGQSVAEEQARFLSLPYLGGRAQASESGEVGVVRHDPEYAVPGLNLYTSGHGPEAVLMDMSGEVLQRWRYPFERAFPDVEPTRDTHFFRRVHPFPDGRLLVLYQTGGLALLDRDSRLLATCRGNFYNDLWVGSDGRIWTIAKELRQRNGQPGRLDDFVVLLHLEEDERRCREERRISLTEAFRRSPYAHLLDLRAPAGDVFHTNAVRELTKPPDSFGQHSGRGSLLVSMREIDVVAVLDPELRRVTWAQRGPWRRQHDPSVLEGGRLLVFDNEGDAGFSRVVEFDPEAREVVWSWSGDPSSSFASRLAGTTQRLDGGNTLVTESVPGRAFEIDSEGRIVWEFRSPHRAGPGRSLVAMLFEVQRLPPRFFKAASLG